MVRIGAGIAIIILGLFAGTVAFWAPAVDPQFGMADVPAWQWTAERAVRHVLPAAAIVVGGALLVLPRRASQITGITLAALGAIWVTIAPIALGTLKSESTWEPGMVVGRKLAHHFGIGPVILGVAMFALGWLVASRPTATAGRREKRVNERPLESSTRT
jgi:hypothetical protein